MKKSSWFILTVLLVAALASQASAIEIRTLNEAKQFFASDAFTQQIASTYAGKDFCKICHTDTIGVPAVYDGWNTTRHASAFDRKFLPAVLAAGGNDSIPSVVSCRPCHTVGFGKPGGYVDFNTTPQFTNIQCENCHGPGSKHQVEANLSAFVCGDCHVGVRRPTITEWEQARHARAKDRFNGTNASTFTPCLVCHSGDFRLARNRAAIQDATNTTRFGVTCGVCHDLHSTVNQSQLRAATPKDMCAQCHFNFDNRGPGFVETNPEIRAMIPDAPHNFQVEMREGRGGINVTSILFMPAVGCNECHMFRRPYNFTGVGEPAITGHTFLPNLTACKECHVTQANLIQAGAGNDTLLRHINLNILQPGRTCDLCHSPGGFSAQGFLITWQGRISDEINKTQANVTLAGSAAAANSALRGAFNIAKFNLDIVNVSDKSRGAHNPFFALALLNNANTLANLVITGQVPIIPGGRGDVNGNGAVDIGDALFVAQAVAGLRQLNPAQTTAADVNGNSAVDIGDALFISQALAGLRTL